MLPTNDESEVTGKQKNIKPSGRFLENLMPLQCDISESMQGWEMSVETDYSRGPQAL